MTEQDFELGRWVAGQRRRKVPWKVLQRKTGLGRTKLYETMCAATGAGGLEALGGQVVLAVRQELERRGRVEVKVNGRTVAVQVDLTVVDPS